MKSTNKFNIIFWVSVCCIVFFMWLGNEGDNPLAYLGSELQYSVGLLDSEYALVIRESVARTGTVASTPELVVNRGTYTIDFEYSAEDGSNVIELWDQGNKVAAWPLDAEQKHFSMDFTLTKDA